MLLRSNFSSFPQYFFYLLLDFYVKAGTRFSLRDKRLFEISEFEIARVNCMCARRTQVNLFMYAYYAQSSLFARRTLSSLAIPKRLNTQSDLNHPKLNFLKLWLNYEHNYPTYSKIRRDQSEAYSSDFIAHFKSLSVFSCIKTVHTDRAYYV